MLRRRLNSAPAWEINYASPLVRHPIVIMACSEVVGQPKARGLGYNGPLTLVDTADFGPGTGSAFTKGRMGARFGATADTFDNWKVPSQASDLISTDKVTIAFVRKRADTTLTAGSNFGVIPDAGTATRAGGHAPYADGVVYWDFGGVSAPNRLSWSGYTVTAAAEAWVFVAGPRGSAIYLNGLQQASQGTAVTRTQQAQSIGLNAGNGVLTGDANIIFLFAVFDAEWTAAEVAQWAANPFSIIRSVRPFNFGFVPPAAAFTWVPPQQGADNLMRQIKMIRTGP